MRQRGPHTAQTIRTLGGAKCCQRWVGRPGRGPVTDTLGPSENLRAGTNVQMAWPSISEPFSGFSVLAGPAEVARHPRKPPAPRVCLQSAPFWIWQSVFRKSGWDLLGADVSTLCICSHSCISYKYTMTRALKRVQVPPFWKLWSRPMASEPAGEPALKTGQRHQMVAATHAPRGLPHPTPGYPRAIEISPLSL